MTKPTVTRSSITDRVPIPVPSISSMSSTTCTRRCTSKPTYPRKNRGNAAFQGLQPQAYILTPGALHDDGYKRVIPHEPEYLARKKYDLSVPTPSARPNRRPKKKKKSGLLMRQFADRREKRRTDGLPRLLDTYMYATSAIWAFFFLIYLPLLYLAVYPTSWLWRVEGLISSLPYFHYTQARLLGDDFILVSRVSVWRWW
ncbi:hypothetical protein P167DRAFT_1112 [Morchella conica CCBAS932]|uniref:Uncharacterized protein n=1 Tax=Morchella conica CCBAS932 TaxID=1392247 RepID=A0A3N4L7R3_9PEZI|nr:hypothetical protein P167DRAFT_1112 [Morchella conica CCBAS932]